MKPQIISSDILQEKYAQRDEQGANAIRRRVARALAACENTVGDWERLFFTAQANGFIPAGRINAAIGTSLNATLINCFVQPVGDSISGLDDHGRPGIYTALQQAAETLRRGGGVGYDFSSIRPQGALVRGTQSKASGPLSYMRVFDRSCETVESAGARRGAQMGVLRVDHPDIETFVRAKDKPGELTNFNISVSMSDLFMRAVIDDAIVELLHDAEPYDTAGNGTAYRRADGCWVYRRLPARQVFDAISARSYHHGDPGMIFIDTVNRENNLYYTEHIDATNPCAEQPLPPYGCCCLGSIDLTLFVRHPFTADAYFDYKALATLVPVAVRMLDNVLDASVWPLEAQKREAEAKRRVGLGFFGLGDCLIMLGQRYDSELARHTAATIARRMRDEAYRASVQLAKEKEPFPEFDAVLFLRSAFVQRLPEELQEAIRRHGLRNSHLLSIAPTGTISLAFADNASNGIEPAYSWCYARKKRLRERKTRTYRVEDHAYRLYRERFGNHAPLSEAFVSALEIGVGDHMRMVAAVAPYVDSSISKTVNVPIDQTFAEFKDLYLDAWRLGLKALSTFRPNVERDSVLSTRLPPGDADSLPGEHCPECGKPSLRKLDGCRYCSACGFDGECG